MGFFNRTKRSAGGGSHLNFMGGKSWTVRDPVVRFRIAAASCFFGEPQYYHLGEGEPAKARARHDSSLDAAEVAHLAATLGELDGSSWRGDGSAVRLEKAIDAALDHDPRATLEAAVALRREDHLRTTPQVALVRAARHAKVRGTTLVGEYAPGILGRADEPAVGLAYQLHRFGKPIPNALKRAWAKALSGASEYSLAKYRLESRETKTVDVMNLVHPKSEAIGKLAKGELTTSERTWESIISAKGSKRAAWEEALEVMGHMALLRNLRNLVGAGVPEERFVERLVGGVKGGKQLPFRYWSAYRALESSGHAPARLMGALERCVELSLGEVPAFRGRVMSLADNSGSARGTFTSSLGSVQVATIANLTAVLTAQRSDEGWVGIFGDRLERFAVRRTSSTFSELARAEKVGESIGPSTENGIWLFFDRAIRAKERWDSIFVYSDMQAGHGGLYGTTPSDYSDYAWMGSRYIDVARLVSKYRQDVNPAVQVFLVQVAGYQDTIVPDVYDRTYVLGGWGEGLLRYAARMAELAA